MLAVAGCGASSGPAPTASSGTGGTAWSDCGDPMTPALECATLTVPLDWSTPGGAQTELALIRLPASNQQERIGSLVFNPGGPGVSGVATVRGAGAALDAYGGGRFDFVSWDPRGSTMSCFADDRAADEFWVGARIPSTAGESEQFQQRTVALAQQCASQLGEYLASVSTTSTAHDLDAIRQFVGDEQLTFVGNSYGTFIGQVYANLYPERVRAMILDGVIDGETWAADAETRTLGAIASSDEVAAQFLALCDAAGADRCALAGHPGQTAAQRVAQLLAQARSAPIPAPDANPAGELTYGELVFSGQLALTSPSSWAGYAQLLDSAADGNASALLDTVRGAESAAYFGAVTNAAAIACADGPAETSSMEWATVIPEFEAASAWFGLGLGWTLWAPCASGWPAPIGERYTGPWDASTEHPILVVGTRYDPATGYQNAVAVSERLGNAVLLTHEGYGHMSSADPSACVEQAQTAYLVELVVPADGTVCESDGVPFG